MHICVCVFICIWWPHNTSKQQIYYVFIFGNTFNCTFSLAVDSVLFLFDFKFIWELDKLRIRIKYCNDVGTKSASVTNNNCNCICSNSVNSNRVSILFLWIFMWQQTNIQQSLLSCVDKTKKKQKETVFKTNNRKVFALICMTTWTNGGEDERTG